MLILSSSKKFKIFKMLRSYAKFREMDRKFIAQLRNKFVAQVLKMAQAMQFFMKSAAGRPFHRKSFQLEKLQKKSEFFEK